MKHKIAVIGGTGLIGSAVTSRLHQAGHSVSSVSRRSGADLLTGEGLDAALEGVDTVIDLSNTNADNPVDMVNFFTRGAANLLAAEKKAAVTHHVLLSIIGVDLTLEYPHFLGKMAQETTVKKGGIPYSIVRAAEFFEFAESAVEWGLKNGHSDVPPLLMQPVAVADVARLLVELATSKPTNDTTEIAGPERHDLVDMARRIRASRGKPPLELIPSWVESGFGVEMAGNLLLPQPGARIASTTLEEWLRSPSP